MSVVLLVSPQRALTLSTPYGQNEERCCEVVTADGNRLINPDSAEPDRKQRRSRQRFTPRWHVTYSYTRLTGPALPSSNSNWLQNSPNILHSKTIPPLIEALFLHCELLLQLHNHLTFLQGSLIGAQIRGNTAAFIELHRLSQTNCSNSETWHITVVLLSGQTDRRRQTQTDTDRHRQPHPDTDRHGQTHPDTPRNRNTNTDTQKNNQTKT